jgi:hemerythrin-like domain-containing protein
MEINELMSAMSLVETNHRLILEKLELVKESLGCLMKPEITRAPVIQKFQDLVQAIAARFSAHLAQQEVQLFPFLLKHLPEEPDLVSDLRKEHDQIEHKMEEMSNCLKVALELEENVPHAVLWDIATYGWELWELLDSHAHRETRAVRQCFSKFLQTVPGM